MADLTLTTAQFDSIPACRTGTARLVQALGKFWTDDDPVPIAFVIDVLGEEYALLALNALNLAPKVQEALAEQVPLTLPEIAEALAVPTDRVTVEVDFSGYEVSSEEALAQAVTANQAI